jgi:hypothetical protein
MALTPIGRALFALLFLTQLGVAVPTLIVGMFTGAEPLFVQWSTVYGALGLGLLALAGCVLALAGLVFRPLLIVSTGLAIYCGCSFILLAH